MTLVPLAVTARYCGTRIADPPTHSGRSGRGWRLDLPPVGQRGQPDWDATVGMFIVTVPGAHIAWDHWMISVIHLRQIEGVRPAAIRLAGATHEFVIASLDPSSPLPGLRVVADWAPRFLRPIDVVEQFMAKNDAVASEILELAIEAIVHGVASPDQDWRPWWEDAIAKTAKHYAEGRHSTGSVQ